MRKRTSRLFLCLLSILLVMTGALPAAAASQASVVRVDKNPGGQATASVNSILDVAAPDWERLSDVTYAVYNGNGSRVAGRYV
ncbi:hypothetical protein [Paenibacillus contaminans]|uniref:Uncharacterized protein n=1 Tax=Paenibacillus contaminans TaxID=450362 RepID=A0A329MNE5_9BACL|nr:hypothetical protein [Paenibacillus contaminans]RAV20243.1 hypothetical protein DQG23_17430 [Paenibacillus contaminans]